MVALAYGLMALLCGSGNRFAIIGWIWSSAHRDLSDERATLAVRLGRVLSAAFVVFVVALAELGQHMRA